MALGASRRRKKGEPVPNAASQVAKKGKSSNGPIALRAPSKATPAVLAVGSSTGGPQALLQFFRELNDDIDLPIFVTQHMPATFTGILAQHISNIAGCEAKEGEDGEIIKHGIIYIAPGDYHMVLERGSTGNIIRLNQEPPQNFCRPSVDPMLSSMVDLYGNKLLCIILTGMGQDGLKGAEVVVNAGGTVVAQDEDTSIVWGMPGAVAEAGLCSAVLPMGKIAGHVSEIVGRK